MNNSDNAYKIGKIMGEELLKLGINFNLAPSLDVNNNPNNPYGFGDLLIHKLNNVFKEDSNFIDSLEKEDIC